MKTLQHELRLEKARQAQRLESELAGRDGGSSRAPELNEEGDAARSRGDETFDEPLLSP